MKIKFANLIINSQSQRLRVSDFKYQVGYTKEDMDSVRGLRTRTAKLLSQAASTKLSLTLENTPSLYKALTVCMLKGYDETNAVYYPLDSHLIDATQLATVDAQLIEDDSKYRFANGYVDYVRFNFNSMSFPTVDLDIYYPQVPATITEISDLQPEMPILPVNISVKYALWVEGVLGNYLPIQASEFIFDMKQSIEPIIGKNGLVSSMYSTEFTSIVNLTCQSTYANIFENAYYNKQDVSLLIDWILDDKQVRYTFPRLSITDMSKINNYGIISIELTPNAINYVPLQAKIV